VVEVEQVVVAEVVMEVFLTLKEVEEQVVVAIPRLPLMLRQVLFSHITQLQVVVGEVMEATLMMVITEVVVEPVPSQVQMLRELV